MRTERTWAARARAGATLIEVLIVLALSGLAVAKVGMVMRQTGEAVRGESSALVLEDQARLVLERIAMAIIGSDREALVPQNTAFPLHTTRLLYRVSLGIQDGEVVWTDPEQIALGGTQVRWSENPGEPGERAVVWTNLVRDFLEGELQNGVDDNDNGLIDEEGLSFVIEDNHVTIRLSLAVMGPEGRTSIRTVETLVTCRNQTAPS